ncbi:HNH endonuclease [Hyunsoonleella ulvae]|uniref:HNH endonuclease n=1 Tax=Hyunsoonleella ulvae TaxID=2799948 RepID=UPI001939E912|nr:HNH endonuclease [Hyunsoonleella ulvae]
MKSYLFAWNPKKWDWTTLEESIDQIEQTGRANEKWSVVSHKKIKAGDRAFLMRLGQEPKGIMGSGFVTSNPFLSPHWDGSGRLVKRVMIDFEVLLNPNEEPLLNLNLLNQGNLGQVNWTPQSSGVEIKPEVTAELEAVWFDFLTTQDIRVNPFQENENSEQTVYTEGTPNQVRITKYERNPHARNKCIEHYGLSCSVCEFNFEDEYGELGKNFIHVHHLKQVSDIGKEYKVNPIVDLRPVCPNCHAMIHRKKEPYSIEEIKKRMEKASR